MALFWYAALLRFLVYTAVSNPPLGVPPCSNVIVVIRMRRLRAVYQVNVFTPCTSETYNIVQSLPEPHILLTLRAIPYQFGPVVELLLLATCNPLS